MTIRRLAILTGTITLAGLVPALPAAAHGAPTTPISRTAACAAGGSATGSTACKAARTANDGAFGTFDNLRVPNVNGNDRRKVPDGELCSGGLDNFKGLDIARDDFPATKVSSGQTLKIRYRATIPHAGSFRIYLTGGGYDPEKKLTWDDLGRKPIAEVTDPPLTGGSYTLRAKLPERTGRQILYVVWETSSTPDTYYSCSDLAFRAAPKPAATKPAVTPASRTKASPSATPSEEPAAAPDTTAEPPATAQARDLTPVGNESNVTMGHLIVVGAVLLGGAALLWALVGGMIRRRRESR